MNKEETDRIADTFIQSLTTGDVATLEALLAPDYVVWYNTLNGEVSREDSLKILASLSQDLPGFNYQDIRRFHTDEGFVQHHTVCGQTKDGKPFRVPACFFVTVRDGQIAYVREYFDSAQDPRT